MFTTRKETVNRYVRGRGTSRALAAAAVAFVCMGLYACGEASRTATDPSQAAKRAVVAPPPSHMTPALRREIGLMAACLRAHGIHIPPQESSGSIDMSRVNQHTSRYQVELATCIRKLRPEITRNRQETRERGKRAAGS